MGAWIVFLAACDAGAADGDGATPIPTAKKCPEGQATYLGFRGTGMPPAKLATEIVARIPDALVVEVADGTLGVITAEAHSMDLRQRHEAAAAAVGWKGDVVDFPTVTRKCELSFPHHF